MLGKVLYLVQLSRNQCCELADKLLCILALDSACGGRHKRAVPEVLIPAKPKADETHDLVDSDF
jgi:hypothetical protein